MSKIRRKYILWTPFVLLLSLFLLSGCTATGVSETPDEEAVVDREMISTEEEVLPDLGKVVALQPIGVLSVDAGPKSVELMPGGERVFVNDLYARKCFIFDAHDYTLLKIILLPDEPVEAGFTEGGRLAWVSQHNSSKVLVVDTETGDIVGEVPTGKTPKEVAVSPNGKWIYVANWDSNTVTVIDAETKQTVKALSMYGTPRGICFSPQGDYAYVCVMGGNTLAEVDVENGHEVVRQIYCGQNPRHVVISPDGETLYVSNNLPGAVTGLDRESGAITTTIKVGDKARTLAITREGDYLFVCNYDDATVSCVDPDTQSEVFTIDAFRPIGLAVSAEGDRLFVCQYAPPQVAIYEIVREE